MKKHALLLLSLVFLLGCTVTPNDETPVIDENVIIEEQEMENRYEQTVDFLDKAESLPVSELVENNRDYYIANAAPDGPEYIKLHLSAWRVGTFKTTAYAGQSLILVTQECDGPCSPAYFRYAVDETTDTWTLLENYSSDQQTWVGGPKDAIDSTVEIPELDVPETLGIYQNDAVSLISAFSRLDANFYPESELIGDMDSYESLEDVADLSFPGYYLAGGCIYGVSPDGMMSRYTVLPAQFMQVNKEGNFDPSAFLGKELNFVDMEGNEETHSYALSAGGCGLTWSCLLTFELTSDEQASLEEVGTLDGRSVYLPESVGERPEVYTEQSLDSTLYSAYDNYLMAREYAAEDTETAPVSMEEFLASKGVFIIALDNGSYILTLDSSYAPVAECGKPVIYLYPQKNTLVHVEVGIDEFTKTIPDYGKNGWTVFARPSGLLTNLVDKLDYPYLFWEGISYASHDSGDTWTLAKTELDTQLPVALMDMGLNARESADFMEFWLPKLEAGESPFVEFSFVNETVMDKIAPLDIRPMPDQVLRIFMYYRGVEEEGNSMPNYLSAQRFGFTVVEWGGSLY